MEEEGSPNRPGSRLVAVFALVRQAVAAFLDDDMSTHAAALAFRLLFSLFPFLIVLVSLLAFLDVPQLFAWMREQAALVVPAQAMAGVNEGIDGIAERREGLLSIGVALTLWSASSVVRATMKAMNVAYKVERQRPMWKRYPLSVFFTLAIAIALALAAVVMAAGPAVMGWLAGEVGMERAFVTVWAWLRWPAAAFLMVVAVSLLYSTVPNVQQDVHLLTPGAVLCVLVWIAASVGFSYYVRDFAGFDAYGSIGAILMLLAYFYLSAAVLLLGAEINAQSARDRAALHGRLGR